MPVDRISTKAGRGESGSRDWQSGTLSVVFMGELPEEVNRGTMCGGHLPLEEFKEEHVRWREPQGHRGRDPGKVVGKDGGGQARQGHCGSR